MNPLLLKPYRFWPHRFWLAALAAALLVLLAAPPVGHRLRAELEEKRAAQTAKIEALSSQIEQWREDAQAARELSKTMDGENVESYLTPMSRAVLAARLEPLAAQARLSNLTYTLGPEEKWKGEPAFPALEGLAQSALTFEAEAGLDTDILSFLHSLETLPGRMDLERLSLKRIDSGPEAPLGARNLKLRAELTWIANASEAKAVP